MDAKTLNERQLILHLAKQEAYKKRDECQSDFNKLEDQLNTLNADGASFAEKDKLLDSMVYMQSCVDGWQETIESIRKWEKELNFH